MAAPAWVHKILAKHSDAPHTPSAKPEAFKAKRPIMADIKLSEPVSRASSRSKLAAQLTQLKSR